MQHLHKKMLCQLHETRRESGRGRNDAIKNKNKNKGVGAGFELKFRKIKRNRLK